MAFVPSQSYIDAMNRAGRKGDGSGEPLNPNPSATSTTTISHSSGKPMLSTNYLADAHRGLTTKQSNDARRAAWAAMEASNKAKPKPTPTPTPRPTPRPTPTPTPTPRPTPKPTPAPTPTPTPRPIEEKVKLIPGLEERISTPAPEGTDKITLLVGKNGDMTTTIGDDNEITRSDIGNDNSETELRLKVAPIVIPATDEQIAIRSEAKEKAQNFLDLFGSVGKTGDMTTSIGNRNIITDSSIGNDNSKTYASFDYGTGLNFS